MWWEEGICLVLRCPKNFGPKIEEHRVGFYSNRGCACFCFAFLCERVCVCVRWRALMRCFIRDCSGGQRVLLGVVLFLVDACLTLSRGYSSQQQ